VRRRFLCSEIPAPAAAVTLDAAESRHLGTVMRAETGADLILADGAGTTAVATVIDTGSGRRPCITCRVDDVTVHPRPAPRLTICIAPPRGKGMAQIVRQATELGVAEIVPVTCEFSVARPDARAAENWRHDSREAVKQSGNPWAVAVAPPVPFDDALSMAPASGYIGWAPGDPLPTAGAAPTDADADVITLWIGPEGGFSAAERDALLAHGLQPLVAGRWTLRVETAAVACITRILS
jgi:16S rRNA (uracil1498-N3)-methyltransferase